MSADIETAAIVDPRIVQKRPAFAVNKGALSVNNSPFNAISASASQMTFNIYAPSENVFVDRAIEWSSDVYLLTTVATPDAAKVPLNTILTLGQGAALCPFPLNSLCATLTATVNDTVATINSQDVLSPVLRLTDYKENRLQRTCPTMLDNYLAYADGEGTINTPLGDYANQTAKDITPNGAFPYIEFTSPDGTKLPAGLSAAALAAAFPSWSPAPNYGTDANGAPRYDAAAVGAGTTYQVYVHFRSTEKFVLSPFVFADSHEHDVGLFGINNIQIVANFQAPSRILRCDPTYATLSGTAFQSTPFKNAVVNVQFLTPNLDVDLPPKSVVPYMEFPRYISSPGEAIAAGAKGQVVSQTVTLPQIPDFLIVFVRGRKLQAAPASQDPADPRFADGYLSVATRWDSVSAPLQVQWDNFSGLLSSHTAEELYGMCVNNGLEMDWQTWSGRGKVNGANVGLCGGPLVLRYGKDIVLREGQAPSCVGNFTLQLSLQVKNNYAFSVEPIMTIITANAGFFESIRGSSRIIKGVLSEQMVINAPMAGSHADMSRLVGAGFFSKLGNALSKAKEIYHATKPVVSAIKGALPEEGMAGNVKGALGAVGYGQTGAGYTGRGMTGRGAKGLAARMM